MAKELEIEDEDELALMRDYNMLTYTLEIGVYPSRRLGRLGADPDGPRPCLVLARGQKAHQPQQRLHTVL